MHTEMDKMKTFVVTTTFKRISCKMRKSEEYIKTKLYKLIYIYIY